jgi:uncharacterized protein YegP (UPF0339 family)
LYYTKGDKPTFEKTNKMIQVDTLRKAIEITGNGTREGENKCGQKMICIRFKGTDYINHWFVIEDDGTAWFEQSFNCGNGKVMATFKAFHHKWNLEKRIEKLTISI